MKYIMIAVAIVGLSGLAHAGAGEETFALDMSAIPGGKILYLKCSKSRDAANCGLPSIWEQTNALPGLQTGIFSYGGRPYQPDARLLP